MTAQEAYKMFKQTKPELVVMSCHEYDSCFVFHAVPPSFATKEKASRTFNSLFAVDKRNNDVTAFTPLDIPTNEYKRGKRLPIFDKH